MSFRRALHTLSAAKFSPPATALPTREEMQRRLDDVRDEQRRLWSVQKSSGLSPKDHARNADLGRAELKLMADLRDLGKRRLGQLHKRR